MRKFLGSIDEIDLSGRKLFELGWGLIFVLVMTVLAEYGPRARFSKAVPVHEAAISSPVIGHGIK